MAENEQTNTGLKAGGGYRAMTLDDAMHLLREANERNRRLESEVSRLRVALRRLRESASEALENRG